MTLRAKYCCPTCGHPLLPADPLAFLTPLQRRAVKIVDEAGGVGISGIDLHERLYGNAPNGGPNYKTVHALVRNTNLRLRLVGLQIRAPKGRGNTGYRLTRLAATVDNRRAPFAVNPESV